ncbi:MAG: methionyl-tRNA formyltransferase, partial [Acidimicrobiales bacterium]
MARLAFLGSPEAAVPSLRALIDAGHDIVVVVSQPDKRRGRGAGPAPSPVKQAALDAGLTVTDRIDDVLGSDAELGIVVAYGRIVPSRVLERTPMLNAHFSLLPRWRGAAPVERAILAGDHVTGVSIMRLEAGLDTGPVLVVRREPIHNAQREHASALTNRLAATAAELLVEVLSGGVAMLGPGKTQVGEATYAAKIEPEDLRLDFSRIVAELERIVRLDRAWTTFRGERLLVLDAVGRDGRARASSHGRGCPSVGEPS